MAFNSEGTLVTDSREIAISETWETQTEWEQNQSTSGLEITNGVIQLGQIPGVPTEGLLHHYDFSAASTTTSEVEDLAGSDNITGTFSGLSNTINGVQSGTFTGGDNVSVGFGTTIDQPYILYYVGDFEDNGKNQYIDDSGDNSITGRRYGDGIYQVNAGNNFDGGSLTTEPEIVRTEFRGGSSSIHRNSQQQTTGSSGSNSCTGVTVSRDGNMVGEIGEIMFYDPDASGYDTSAVEIYLSNKWGISLS